MTLEDFSAVSPDTHKECTHALQRLMDFLDRFVPANLALIKDHEEKLRANKHTRRIVPDSLFRQATDIMDMMLKKFRKIRITPVSSNNDFIMADYYSSGLSAFDRSMHDSRRVADTNSYLYERVFPIAASQSDIVELQSIIPLAEELIQILRSAP